MIKLVSVDIETDFRRKMLNIGWCKNNRSDVGKNFWIWQDVKRLYYPADCDTKYISILEYWRVAEKTPIGKVLEIFLKDVSNKVITGWNIKSFDIPIIAKYIKKYLGIDWLPDYIDGYRIMQRLIKERPALCNKLMKQNGLTASGKFPSLTAESMFKYLTGCRGYQEHHSALFDAQDERHVIQLLFKSFKLRLIDEVQKFDKIYK